MVPDSYIAYFTGTATAAGALIGLLFVAVSLRPDSIFGKASTADGRLLAGSAFTALVNAFFISLIALIPNVSIGIAACVLAVLSLFSTVRTHREVHGRERHWSMLALALAAYLAELTVGVVLTLDEHAAGGLSTLAYVTIGSFAVALARAWALVRGSHLEPK